MKIKQKKVFVKLKKDLMESQLAKKTVFLLVGSFFSTMVLADSGNSVVEACPSVGSLSWNPAQAVNDNDEYSSQNMYNGKKTGYYQATDSVTGALWSSELLKGHYDKSGIVGLAYVNLNIKTGSVACVYFNAQAFFSYTILEPYAPGTTVPDPEKNVYNTGFSIADASEWLNLGAGIKQCWTSRYGPHECKFQIKPITVDGQPN